MRLADAIQLEQKAPQVGARGEQQRVVIDPGPTAPGHSPRAPLLAQLDERAMALDAEAGAARSAPERAHPQDPLEPLAAAGRVGDAQPHGAQRDVTR